MVAMSLRFQSHIALLVMIMAACTGGEDPMEAMPGALNQPCKPQSICNPGLICLDDLCVSEDSVTDGGMQGADTGEGGPDIGTEMACGQFELHRVIAKTPANVSVFFSVTDCEGNPMPGYDAMDFDLLEDEQTQSSMDGPYKLNADQGYRHFHHLVVDLSDLTNVTRLITSLREFLDQAVMNDGSNFIAISAFDGRPRLSSIIDFSNDLGALNNAADSLIGFSPEGTAANLNGAVGEALSLTEQAIDSSEAGLATGSLVIITDGIDQAGYVETASVSARISQSSLKFFTIGIGSNIESSTLMAWGKTEFQEIEDFGRLLATMKSVGKRFADISSANYVLSYCSVQRSGEHKATVRIANVSGELEYSYDAAGFTDGCMSSAAMDPCSSRMCGAVDGLICGTCAPNELCNQAGICEEAQQPPTMPNTLNDLLCQVETESVDPNGDSITYIYRWEKDAQDTGVTGQNLSWDLTSKNENWRCSVTPSDGTLDGQPGSASITVANSAPTAPTVTATPTAATTVDAVTCLVSVDAFDADSDSLNYQYRWQSGSNIQVGPVLSSTATTKNQQWTCSVTANDGQTDGPAGTSPTVRIENSAPTAPLVQITPELASNQTDLNCTITTASNDVDGDPIQYTYNWSNGTTNLTGQTISASQLSVGDVWTCSVIPSDGFLTGDPGSDSTRIWNGCTGLEFDGIDDYIELGSDSALRIEGDLSIEFWLKAADLSAGELVRFGGDINSSSETQNIVYRIGLDSSPGHLRFMHESGNGVGPNFVTGSSLIQIGQWHHVALVRNDLLKTYRLFVDGTPLPFTIYSSSATGGSLGELTIGGVSAGSSGDFFNGIIDEVRIWNKQLSQNEIQTNDHGPIDPNTAQGIVGYWPLHAGTGTTAWNLSVQGQNGIIHGASWSSVSACDAP